jgi:hypothetical protein
MSIDKRNIQKLHPSMRINVIATVTSWNNYFAVESNSCFIYCFQYFRTYLCFICCFQCVHTGLLRISSAPQLQKHEQATLPFEWQTSYSGKLIVATRDVTLWYEVELVYLAKVQ